MLVSVGLLVIFTFEKKRDVQKGASGARGGGGLVLEEYDGRWGAYRNNLGNKL